MGNPIIISIIFCIILLAGYTCMVYIHEETHQTIAEYYGYNATIKMNIFGNSYTNITRTDGYNHDHELLQDETDIVGYQMNMFYIIFTSTIAMMLIFTTNPRQTK